MTTTNREKIIEVAEARAQEIETLISEEAFLFAKYLREEKKDWLPRIGIAEKAQAGSSIADSTIRFLEKPD